MFNPLYFPCRLETQNLDDSSSLTKTQIERSKEETQTHLRQSVALVRSLKKLENRSLKDLGRAELERFSRECLEGLKLLQKRSELQDINNFEGVETDEIDEILLDLKQKIKLFEEDFDGERLNEGDKKIIKDDMDGEPLGERDLVLIRDFMVIKGGGGLREFGGFTIGKGR